MAIKLRPEVQWFAEQMERTLRRNDHKGGWNTTSAYELLDRLEEEFKEIERAMARGLKSKTIIREATDVANFAMMIADVMRANT